MIDQNNKNKKVNTKILSVAFILALNTSSFASAQSDELLDAIETKNISLVESLVRYGVDPNKSASIYNVTPLMFAVDAGSVGVVQKLINLGSEIDITDNFGNTPLIHSIKTNKNNIASLLIKNSININMSDDRGISALLYAAKHGNEALFKQILKHGGNLKAIDGSGNNALFYAIAGRNKEIINKLLNMEYFDLTHTNRSGENAFKIAQRYALYDVSHRIAKGRN